MPEYVLTVANNAYDNELYTNHLIEAEDRQMVKYWYHHTQRSFGYTNAFGDEQYKHSLQAPMGGLVTEIQRIRQVDSDEADTLEKHLSRWPKTEE